MRPGGKVSFSYDLDVEGLEDHSVTVEVEATISDYHPAVMHLANGDPGYPAEGGEVEDLRVLLQDGTEVSPTPELYEKLVVRAQEKHSDG